MFEYFGRSPASGHFQDCISCDVYRATPLVQVPPFSHFLVSFSFASRPVLYGQKGINQPTQRNFGLPQLLQSKSETFYPIARCSCSKTVPMASSGSSEKKETAHADLCNQPVMGKKYKRTVFKYLYLWLAVTVPVIANSEC